MKRGRKVISTIGKDIIFDHKWSELFKIFTFTVSAENYVYVNLLNGDKKKERVHRVIMGALPNQIVDHINGNTLDNRECNLRVCTQSENTKNRIGWSKQTASKYKGIHLRKKCIFNKWCAQITVNRKKIYLGVFNTEEEGALAYNDAAIKYFGEFARLNEIK